MPGTAGEHTDTTGADQAVERHTITITITITVNEHPVQVTERELTGREIKQAAIDQGVAIGLDFVLYEHLGQHRTRIVGDDEPVRVHRKSRFEALANDDNS
jgi:Multiubiquitin